MKPDTLGIWDEGDQVQPTEWLKQTATIREAVEEFDSEDDVRLDSIWWRVSVVTLTASLLGFTLGAGVGRIREPETASPWQQLFLEDATVAAPVAHAAKRDTNKVTRPTKKSRSIKLAAVAKPNTRARVKGMVISRATTTGYLPVASGAATTVVRRPSSNVTLIKRPSRSGGSDRPDRVHNPAPPPAAEPTPSASPSSAPEEEVPDKDFDDRRTRDRDDDPDPTPPPDDDDGEEEPDNGSEEEPEEPSEPEDDGPGNSDNAPGHNKDKGKGPKD